MNNKGVGLLGVIVILAILFVFAASGYFWLKSGKISEETNVGNIVGEAPEEEWKEYTNERLGFSIKLPPEAYDWREGKNLPLVVYEDGKSNVVYVSAADSERKISYESIAKELGRRRGGITVGAAETRTELDLFIQDYFGTSCGVEKLTAKDKADYFDVNVGGSENCLIGARVDVVYSPKAKKAVALFPRQDVMFYKGIEGINFEAFDAKIIESFEFK